MDSIKEMSQIECIIVLDSMLKGKKMDEDPEKELIKKRALFAAIKELVGCLDEKVKIEYEDYLKVITATEEKWDRCFGNFLD